jgi:hypothetical protein
MMRPIALSGNPASICGSRGQYRTLAVALLDKVESWAKGASPMRSERSVAEKEDFLREDFFDTLRWMLIGAITWKAARTKPCCPNLDVVGMYTALERSRTLYEFFYTVPKYDDDARASQFASGWDFEQQSNQYKKYMSPRSPVNKRISHLVWGRSGHSGGTLEDESDDLKNQVLPCAYDLIQITHKFIALVTPDSLQAVAQFALDEARKEARGAAKEYGIENPFDV